MRQILALSSAIAVCFYCCRDPAPVAHDVVGIASPRSIVRCQDRDRGRDHPSSIEDVALKRHLIKQGGLLIEQGQTVDTPILIEQLERKSCRLDPPRRTTVHRNPVDLFQQTKESVVIVAGLYKCQRCTRWHANTATGFAITATGAVVTNHHVVDDPTQQTMVVMTSDRRVFPVESVLAASRPDDLAILKVPADDLTPLPIASSSNAAPVGSPVGVISHPDGCFYCFTSGIVSRYTRIYSAGRQIDAVSITADYARGSSGAPVLNEFGQVVAVVMSTESIYYTSNGRQQRDLQMVFKLCIPACSLIDLVDPKARDIAVVAAE